VSAGELLPPDIGTAGAIQHGWFRRPCHVVQVSRDGVYVKVREDGTDIYRVFTRNNSGRYLRRHGSAGIWQLIVEAGTIMGEKLWLTDEQLRDRSRTRDKANVE